MNKALSLLLLTICLAGLAGCGSEQPQPPGPGDDNTNTGNDNNGSNDDDGSDDDTTDDDDTSAAPVPVSTFSSINSVILQPRCGGCHGSSGGLSMSYDNLVSQPSDACPGLDYVSPGNPDSSVLILKLEGTTCGTQMPRSGAKLTAEQVAPIRAWISAGAENN